MRCCGPHWRGLGHELDLARDPVSQCAVVGGQGYSAASVAASLPELSVPVVGGPTVPVWTVKFEAAKAPPAVVDLMAFKGFEHDTGMSLPKKAIVG